MRIKVYCYQNEETDGGARRIALRPISGPNAGINANFFKFTPEGLISLSAVDEKVAKHFVPGYHYYVDITPIEDKA